MSRTIRDGSSIFGRGNVILEVDDNGNIYTPGAFNSRDYVGRVDNNGHVYKGMGIYETYVGRIDSNGNLYDNSAFGGNYAGRIDENGVLRDNSAFGGDPSGDVGFGLTNNNRTSKSGSGSIGNKNIGGSGAGVGVGGDIPEPIAIILGIIGLGAIYVIYQIIKGVASFADAIKFLYTYTNAGVITIAAIVIPIVLYFVVDLICVSIYNRSRPQTGFSHFWVKTLRSKESGGDLPLLIGYIVIIAFIVSIVAVKTYIPPAENADSNAGIEQEVFSMEDIVTYKKYMKKLDGTYWRGDDYKVRFSYDPKPEEGYMGYGEATVNGESYKYCFDLGSEGENEDGYGYGYALFKNELDDEDATYLFYDEYFDELTDNNIVLNRKYKNVADEVKWGIITWSKNGWLSSFLPYFTAFSLKAKLLYIGIILVILAIILIPIIASFNKNRGKKL